MFMATLDNLVMTTALPVLQVELSASLEQLQWMVNAYTLSFASLMIAAATLGDRLGRRRVFVTGIVVFALASIASALATDAGTLIAEGLHRNKAHRGGKGINTLTSAVPSPPFGGAPFHDAAVWIRKTG